MPVIPTILDIAKHRQEKKRREKWDPLLEKEQQLMNALREIQAGRETREEKMWQPGMESAPIPGLGGAPYKVPEGLLHKTRRLETEYMRSPEQLQDLAVGQAGRIGTLEEEAGGRTRTAEHEQWKKEQDILDALYRERDRLLHGYDLEIERLRQEGRGAEGLEGVFDGSGNFNTRYFYEAARELYPGFSFFDLIDRGEIDKARNTILKATISALGNEITPADYPRIEAALDEWMNYLFEAHKADPRASFGTVAENVAKLKTRGVSPRGFSRAEILEGARERYGSAFQKIKEAFNRGDRKAPELITPGPTSEGYADERTEKENKLKGLGKKVLEKLKFWK